jgi:hypothetical protein
MDEIFNQEGIKFPKKEKIMKWLPWALSIILLIVFGYSYGFKHWESKIYQQGVAYGSAQTQMDLIKGWWQVGAIQLNVPINSEGKLDFTVDTTYPVVLIQQQTASTTQ